MASPGLAGGEDRVPTGCLPRESSLPTGTAVLTRQTDWRRFAVSDCGCGMRFLRTGLSPEELSQDRSPDRAIALPGVEEFGFQTEAGIDGLVRRGLVGPSWGAVIPFAKWVEPFQNGGMNSQVTLDRAGRVVLPKILRDKMRLSPGDTFDLTIKGDEVTLRPRRGATPLQKERGVWVFRTGKPLTADETEETLRNIRTQRHRQNAGEIR